MDIRRVNGYDDPRFRREVLVEETLKARGARTRSPGFFFMSLTGASAPRSPGRR